MTTPRFRSGATASPWRQTIDVDKIHPGPDNPRNLEPDPDEDVTDLRKSINKFGLLQSLVVRPASIPCPICGSSEQHYIIEAGSRRFMAMQESFEEIPAQIRPILVGENTKVRDILTGLVENINRKDLNPIARAKAFKELEDTGMDQKDIAETVGLSTSTISNDLALLTLAPNIQKKVASRDLSRTDAMAFVKRRRAANRRAAGGTGQAGAQGTYGPNYFTVNHPLARIAEDLCNSHDWHGNRIRRVKSRGYRGACDRAWEIAIRDAAVSEYIATEQAKARFNVRSNARPAEPEAQEP